MQKFILGMIASSFPAMAADFHISPAGSGTKDGSTATNSADGSSISSVFNEKMKPGDRLLLAPGVYEGVSISLATGGENGKPKTLQGSAGTVLKSSWSIETPDKGATAISFGAGLSDVVLKDFSIANYCFSIRANPGEARNRITLDNISMEHMRHGIYVSDCDEMTITGVKMKRYSKHGFRFDQGCDKVTLKNCVADCSEGDAVWETKTEVFPFGFNVNKGGDPNTNFLFEDCVAKNNIKSNQTVKYTNGDGFVVEGNTTGVTFIRCHALRNQDGGFDLKVKDVRLVGCVAIGHRRDYRLWASGHLENCFSGWSTTGFWTKGGPVFLTSCTFLGHRRSAMEIEGSGPVALASCLIASDEDKFTTAIGSFVDSDSSVIAKIPAELGISNPDPKWDGTGPAMNSAKYSDKGYRMPK